MIFKILTCFIINDIRFICKSTSFITKIYKFIFKAYFVINNINLMRIITSRNFAI